MRALTLTQPWAGLVASGIKLVENRPRSMIKREDFGKRFAIHASREIDQSVCERIAEIAPELRPDLKVPLLMRWTALSRITSAVIAVATVNSVVVLDEGDRHPHKPGSGELVDLGDQHRWFFGPVGYLLSEVVALPKPVPCRGWQGFWTLAPELERAVMEQLS